MTPPAPRLSLIACSRNDRYMGNSRWRLETALNYVGARVQELGRLDEVEVLVTDWGSDVPLRTVLHLSAAAARLTSFVEVPPALARSLQQDSPFPEVLALNAAARRARGEHIGRIDQDTLVGERFLRFFFDAPLGDGMFFANRRGIPYRFVVREPDVDQLHRLIRRFGPAMEVFCDSPAYPGTFWTSYVGILLLHRDLWACFGGYDEALLHMNHMETELIHRLSGSVEVVDLGALVDHDFYHLDHYHRGSWWAGAHRQVNAVRDLRQPAPEANPNGDSWGLAAYDLQPVAYDGHDRPPVRERARRPLGVHLVAAGAGMAWDHRRDAAFFARVLRFGPRSRRGAAQAR